MDTDLYTLCTWIQYGGQKRPISYKEMVRARLYCKEPAPKTARIDENCSFIKIDIEATDRDLKLSRAGICAIQFLIFASDFET